MSKAPGKWADPAVPKYGWECVDVYDSLADEDEDAGLRVLCAMCEITPIRYVHVMTNPAWPDEIEAGCICAGRMEQDEARAILREALARRRWRFPQHKNWRTSKRGNRFIRIDRHRLIVRPCNDGYRVRIVTPDDQPIDGRNVFATEKEAMMAAFDGLIWAKRLLR